MAVVPRHTHSVNDIIGASSGGSSAGGLPEERAARIANDEALNQAKVNRVGDDSVSGTLTVGSSKPLDQVGTGERVVLAGADGRQRAEPKAAWDTGVTQLHLTDDAGLQVDLHAGTGQRMQTAAADGTLTPVAEVTWETNGLAVTKSVTGQSSVYWRCKNPAAAGGAQFYAENNNSGFVNATVYGTGKIGTIFGQNEASAAVLICQGNVSFLGIGSYNNVTVILGHNNTERARITVDGFTFVDHVKVTEDAGTGQRMVIADATGTHTPVPEVTWEGGGITTLEVDGIVKGNTLRADDMTGSGERMTVADASGIVRDVTEAVWDQATTRLLVNGTPLVSALRGPLAARPAASAANLGFTHETTDVGKRGVTRSDGSAWNELPLAHRDRMPLNVRDYLDPLGWVNDGSAQPLSGFFASLGAAQAVFPNAAALTDEIAGVAIQYCINLTQPNSTFRGGRVEIPHGSYRVNVGINLTAVASVEIVGESAVWNSYTGLYGGWPNKNMPGTSRLLWTGTGALFSFVDQAPATGIPTKGLSFVKLVFNVDNQTQDIFTADGGTGIFFDQCYFGGGNRQLHYSANTPFDFYFNKCYFGTSLNDTQPNYALYVGSGVTGFGGQSTIFHQCTMRYVAISHVRCDGPAQIKFNSCTLEGTATGPSVHMETPAAGCALYFYNCHWEQIFTSAYWNGTYFQYSAGNSDRACVIRAGTSGSSAAAFVSLFQSDLNLRVIPGVVQLHAFVLYGSVRLAFVDCGLAAGLDKALVYNYDYQRQAVISRIAGSYAPSNGDLMITGPDDTRKSQMFADYQGIAPQSAMWSNRPTSYGTKNASWCAIVTSAAMTTFQWRAAYQAPVYPLRARRELYLLNPSELGGVQLDTDHGPYTRGDTLFYDSWRTGTAQNGGYGTRVGIYCGKDAAASNTADCWFPLITGPGLSGDVGNADLTWNHREFTDQWYNTPLTTTRTLYIANWSVEPNAARLRVIRTASATGAFPLIVYSNKTSTERARVYAGQWVELMYDGATDWRVVGFGNTDGSKVTITTPAGRSGHAVRSDDSRLDTEQQPDTPRPAERLPIAPSSFGGFPTGHLAIPANQHRVNTLAAILGA